MGGILRLHTGHTKIHDFDNPLWRHHQVGRLDVAMNNSFGVGIIQCSGSLFQNGANLFGRKLLARQKHFQRLAFHVLHKNKC